MNNQPTSATPATNAWATLLSFLFFVLAIACAIDGHGSVFFVLLLTSIICALCVDHRALLPEWEQELEAQVHGCHEVVLPDQLAYSHTVGYVQLYHCLGTPDRYTGLDCFGNLVTVEEDEVVGFLPVAQLENPLAA